MALNNFFQPPSSLDAADPQVPYLPLFSAGTPLFGRSGDYQRAQGIQGSASVQANLLLTLLAVSVAVPFSQTSWQNPQAAARRDSQHQSSLILTALAQPFAQVSWPNPRWVATQQPESRGVALALEPARGVAFRPAQWQNAAVIPRRDAGQQPYMLALLAPPAVVASPFFGSTWAMPRYPLQVVYWTGSNTTIIMPPVVPGGAVEWLERARRRGRR